VATNRDLTAATAAGRFRADLLHRLTAAALDLPPLRERREDLPVLLEHLLARLRAGGGRDVTEFSAEALHRLLRHDWPGNVRELESAVEYAAMRTRGPVILAADLPPGVGRAPGEPPGTRGQRCEIAAALAAAGGHPGRAAAMLGIHRTTLWRWRKIGR
jgi:two-component system response regulator HydG